MLRIQRFHLTSMRRVFYVAGMVFCCVFLCVFCVRQAFAATTSSNGDERLVTIHNDGNETTIVTRGATIQDALNQAGVVVNPDDIVEPAQHEKLVAQDYHVNIFRARPVLVIDGTQQVRIMTAEQSPRQIAKVAGMQLYDEDKAKLDRVNDVLGGGGAGLKLTIHRATVFSLTLYGKTFEARTRALTVGDLLQEKNISLGKDDGVSPAQDTSIASAMSVRIWRNGTQTVTVEEVIPKPIEEIKDTSLESGTRQVRTAGVDGKKNVTYEINTQDGAEVSKVAIASVTTLEPVKEVVVVGTKIHLPPGSHTDWMASAGIAKSDYGYVDFIVSHESGWSPTKYNYAGSGAYGLCQSLPASKMASAGADYMTNPITQLKWCNGYAIGRYGSWASAYSFWQANRWW